MRRHANQTKTDWIQMEEEFNDLLTPILGYAEFLQSQLGPDHELAQDMQEIQLAACRLQRLGRRIFASPAGGGGASQYEKKRRRRAQGRDADVL